MAIVVDENKGNRVNIVRLLGWLSIVAIVGGAVYYLFFAAPQVVVIAPPADFKYVAPLAQATFNPEDVLNSPAFQSLKPPPFPLPNPQGPAPVGRSNPFLP